MGLCIFKMFIWFSWQIYRDWYETMQKVQQYMHSLPENILSPCFFVLDDVQDIPYKKRILYYVTIYCIAEFDVPEVFFVVWPFPLVFFSFFCRDLAT